MSEKKDNQMIVPPSGSDGTIMVPPKVEDDLMVPPQPLINEDMMNISGGAGEENNSTEIEPPKPPEMKVVKLEDGRYVKVPLGAICDTEEEAGKIMMPPPPMSPKGLFHPHGHHHGPHHGHHHEHEHND